MVNILSVLSLLFAFTASAAVSPSGVPQINLGTTSAGTSTTGGVLVSGIGDIYGSTVTGGWFTLHGGGQPGANNFSPFVRNGTAYQVPNGYTTKCVQVTYTANTANSAWQFVSDTAAIAVNDTALTAGVYQSSSANICPMRNGAADTYLSQTVQYNFLSQTYAGFQTCGNVGISILVLCKEVAN